MGKGLIRKREVSFFAYAVMVIMMVAMALAPVILDFVVLSEYSSMGVQSGLFSFLDKPYFFFLGATILGGIYFLVREIRHRLKG